MNFPVVLQFKPSRRLRAALVFVHLLALIAVLALKLPVWASTAASIALCVSLPRVLRSISTPVLTLRADGSVLWQCGGGSESPGRVVGGTAFNWLVVLRIQMESIAEKNQVRVLVAISDSLSPPDFRRLQVWSRWVVSVRSALKNAEAS
jgi:hypothetical protein